MHTIYCAIMSSRTYRQLRVRRALSIFKDVLLRSRRVLSLYKVYGDSAILVLNKTLNSVRALLALNWWCVLKLCSRSIKHAEQYNVCHYMNYEECGLSVKKVQLSYALPPQMCLRGGAIQMTMHTQNQEKTFFCCCKCFPIIADYLLKLWRCVWFCKTYKSGKKKWNNKIKRGNGRIITNLAIQLTHTHTETHTHSGIRLCWHFQTHWLRNLRIKNQME